MSIRLTHSVGPDQTRDCLDPWSFVQIRASSDVLPCCLHTPIGKLNGDTSLAKALNDEPIRVLRRSLLTGRLDAECAACHNRTTVHLSDMRLNWIRKFFMSGKTLTGDGSIDLAAHPELREVVEFINVPDDHRALRDRIFLHPQAPTKEPSAVQFKSLSCHPGESLDMFLYLEHPECAGVEFTVQYGGSDARYSTFVRPGRQHFRAPVPLHLGIPFSLTCSVRAARPDYGWFHFTYPFFA
jgi:hypothetical protein